jgi:hypothetical protein
LSLFIFDLEKILVSRKITGIELHPEPAMSTPETEALSHYRPITAEWQPGIYITTIFLWIVRS